MGDSKRIYDFIKSGVVTDEEGTPAASPRFSLGNLGNLSGIVSGNTSSLTSSLQSSFNNYANTGFASGMLNGLDSNAFRYGGAGSVGYNPNDSFVGNTSLSLSNRWNDAAANSIESTLASELSAIKTGNYNNERYNIHTGSVIEDVLVEQGIVRDPELARVIDRSKHIVHDVYLESNVAGPTRSYAYFVKPNLNLFAGGNSSDKGFKLDISATGLASMFSNRRNSSAGSVSLNPDLDKYPVLLSAAMLNLDISLELCRDVCGGSGLIPLLSNHCKEIAPISLQSDDREGVRNMYGKSMQLPGVFNYYDNQLSVTFSDNRYGDISKLFYLLGVYKDHVVREGFKRADKYIARNAIDWATSIYVFTVDQDNFIIGWVKYTGCVSRSLPLNLAQHRSEGFAEGELTGDIVIDFQVFKTNPYRISTLAEFNKISGFSSDRVLPLRRNINKDIKLVTSDASSIMSGGKAAGNGARASIPTMTMAQVQNSSQQYSQMAEFPGIIFDPDERRYRLVFSN